MAGDKIKRALQVIEDATGLDLPDLGVKVAKASRRSEKRTPKMEQAKPLAAKPTQPTSTKPLAAKPTQPTATKPKGKGKPPKPTKAIGTVFDDVTDYDTALAMAQRGEHLKRDKSGQYVGGPRNMSGSGFAVNTPAALGSFRVNYDDKLRRGLFNSDWYDRALNTGANLSGIDLTDITPYVGTNTGNFGSLFARGTAAYSPQYSPSSEVNAFAKQHNAKVVMGQDIVPKTRSQAANVASAYSVDPVTGRFTFDPQAITLGKKTGPYADAKDPMIDPKSLYKTANDIWHGRALRFDQTSGRFDRAFTPQETNFLIGENLLAADRANRAGLRPEGANVTFSWTPRTAQAATWGTERMDDVLAEQDLAVRAFDKAQAKYERDLSRWEAKGKPKGKKPKKPKEPVILSEDEIREYAMGGIDDAVNRNLAAVTGEYMPGFKVKQAPELFDNPELANEFSDVMAQATGARDPAFEALQVYHMPISEIPGGYLNSANVFETNKAYQAPMLGSTFSPTRADIEFGPFKPGVGEGKVGPQMDEATEKALRLSAMMHAPRHAQEGTGANMFIPEKSTHRSSQLNAAEIAGGRPELEQAIEALRGVPGLDVVDMQNLARVTQFPGADVPMSPQEIQKAIGSVDLPEGLSVQTGRLDSTGYWPSWGEEGSGQMTTQWLEDINALGIPNVYERLATPEFTDPIRRENEAREAFLAKYGLSSRDDIRRFTDLLAQGGPKTIRDYVAKYGAQGLPAAIPFGLILPQDEEEQ